MIREFDKPIVLVPDFAEIAALFGIIDLLDAKYLGGVPNVTFRASDSCKQLAVRVCNNGYTSEAHLLCEIEVLQHLASVGYRYSPRLVAGRDGKMLQHWRNYRVIAMEMIKGTTADRVDLDANICWGVGLAGGELRRSLVGCPHSLSDEESYRSRAERLLAMLPRAAASLGWDMDVRTVVGLWRNAAADLGNLSTSHIVHTDIWPPNVLCSGDRVVGIIDFDDLAIGPPMLDLAAVLAEFALDESLHLHKERAAAVLAGYRSSGIALSPREVDAIVPGIVSSYAAWLACNALHRVPFEESEVYAVKLRRLADPQAQRQLSMELRALRSN